MAFVQHGDRNRQQRAQQDDHAQNHDDHDEGDILPSEQLQQQFDHATQHRSNESAPSRKVVPIADDDFRDCDDHDAKSAMSSSHVGRSCDAGDPLPPWAFENHTKSSQWMPAAVQNAGRLMRRERHGKMRRVKPLSFDESEDARERGVEVPHFILPMVELSERIRGRLEDELHSSRAPAERRRPGPAEEARNLYVAVQLKQLAQLVNVAEAARIEHDKNFTIPSLLDTKALGSSTSTLNPSTATPTTTEFGSRPPSNAGTPLRGAHFARTPERSPALAVPSPPTAHYGPVPSPDCRTFDGQDIENALSDITTTKGRGDNDGGSTGNRHVQGTPPTTVGLSDLTSTTMVGYVAAQLERLSQLLDQDLPPGSTANFTDGTHSNVIINNNNRNNISNSFGSWGRDNDTVSSFSTTSSTPPAGEAFLPPSPFQQVHRNLSPGTEANSSSNNSEDIVAVVRENTRLSPSLVVEPGTGLDQRRTGSAPLERNLVLPARSKSAVGGGGRPSFEDKNWTGGDESPTRTTSVAVADENAWSEHDIEARGEVKTEDAAVLQHTSDPFGRAAVPQGEAVGREMLWRQMLAVESRTSSMLASIVRENAPALDQGLVLPCPPSEEEKVLYHNTGKGFLVCMGVLSMTALSTGMWLFTLASPYFYWFGAPTSFLLLYLVISYFGVAVWGKDFQLDEHMETMKKSEEEGYYPTVDVFLPVCGEPTHVLANTWRNVRALDYPRWAVHVLDDGAKEEVKQLAALYGFNYIRRDNRPELKKAGNLRWAFARTHGEIIVIFDADFCPRPDFLRETTPYFVDREIAIVQTPQFFRFRKEQTWVERGAGVTQELFYRMVQTNRNRFHAAICVGSCGVYRREALAPFGGTAAIGYSEDVHTGFNCAQLGYRVKYLPRVLSMGTCPDEPRAFFMQQYRWCMGSTTLLCNKEFWTSRLSVMQKLCYLSGMFYYSATAIAIFMGPMPGLLLIYFKPSAVFWFNISFAVPSIFFSLVAMNIWSKQPYDLCCQRVKVIQSFSHLYAIKDKIMNSQIPWIPSGGGASSRSTSQAYDSSVRLMLAWTTLITVLILAGAVWRSSEFPWYHFLPSCILAVANYTLNLSTVL